MEFIKNHFISFVGVFFVVLGLLGMVMREESKKENELVWLQVISFFVILIITTIVLLNIWNVADTTKIAFEYWSDFKRVEPAFLERWGRWEAPLMKLFLCIIFSIGFAVMWVIVACVLYVAAFIGKTAGIVLILLVSLAVSWVLLPPANGLFWFVAGMFIKHPVEEEAKKWKKGRLPVLDFKAIARKMYSREEGIPPGYDSWIKKERLEKLGKRLDAEKEFMGKVEDHKRGGQGMKKDE